MTRVKRVLMGAAVAFGVCVLASQAFSQVITLVAPFARIPYTVDSAFVRYAKDGSSVVSMYATSYNHNSREIVLSSSMPGHPFATAIRRTLDATGLVLFHLTMPFRVTVEPLWFGVGGFPCDAGDACQSRTSAETGSKGDSRPARSRCRSGD